MPEAYQTGRSGPKAAGWRLRAVVGSLARIVWLPLVIYLTLTLLQAALRHQLAPETREAQRCWTDGVAFTTTLRLLHPAVLRREEAPQPVVASFASQTPPAGLSCAMLPAPGGPFTVSLSASPAILLVDGRQEPVSQTVTMRVSPVDGGMLVVWARHAGLEPPNDAAIVGRVRVDVRLAAVSDTVESVPIMIESRDGYFWRLVATNVLSPGGLLLALAALVVQWSAEQDRERRKREEEQERQGAAEEVERQTRELMHDLEQRPVTRIMTEGLLDRWVSQSRRIPNSVKESKEVNARLIQRLWESFKDDPSQWLDHRTEWRSQLQALAYLVTDAEAAAPLSDLAWILDRWADRENLPPAQSLTSPFMAGFSAALLDEKHLPDAAWLWSLANRHPQDFLRGALACENALHRQNAGRQSQRAVSSALLQAMARREFWTERLSLTDLRRFIENCNASADSSRLAALCRELTEAWQKQERQYRDDKGYPRVRRLWPLESLSDPKHTGDANYDFEVETGFNSARVTELVEHINVPAVNEHFLVVGERGAGKTALRLYLEYFCQTTGNTLPVFYFAPRALLDNCALPRQMHYLAACLGNELFARLCETDGQLLHAAPVRSLSQQEEEVIAHFLKRYGYRVPSPADSLFWPVPPADRTDVDRLYRQTFLGLFYNRMRNAIDGLPLVASEADSALPGRVCSDMAQVMSAAGFERALLLIDNMDDALRYTPAPVFAGLVATLLEAGDMLAQHRIFVIAFLPTQVFDALPESILGRLVPGDGAQSADGGLTLRRLSQSCI